MMNSQELSLPVVVYRAYASGRTFHGDFGMTPEVFAENLQCIIHRHLGRVATNSEASLMCKKLHLVDLYLSFGCSCGREAAWRRFSSFYDKYIHDLARFMCSTRDAARELGDSIVGHLFLPDRTGHSRIAGYDGRCSLRTWLRAIIKHRAIDDRELRANNNEPLECAPETIDYTSLRKMDQMTRTNRYEAIITHTLKQAVEELGDEDRRLLALKYSKRRMQLA